MTTPMPASVSALVFPPPPACTLRGITTWCRSWPPSGAAWAWSPRGLAKEFDENAGSTERLAALSRRQAGAESAGKPKSGPRPVNPEAEVHRPALQAVARAAPQGRKQRGAAHNRLKGVKTHPRATSIEYCSSSSSWPAWGRIEYICLHAVRGSTSATAAGSKQSRCPNDPPTL